MADEPEHKRAQWEFRLQCKLVRDVRKILMPNVLMFAIPNGEKRSRETFARIAAMGGVNGLPDLAFLVPSRPHLPARIIGLELKTEADPLRGIKRGKQTDEQEHLGRLWTLAGGVYFCAYGYAQAIDFLDAAGVIRPDRSIIPAEATE